MSETVLEARELSKSYGHVRALHNVSMTIARGEIVALLGDNGAGKSTFIKCISGAVVPDSGEIIVGGRAVKIRSTKEARALGIETVFQDLALAPSLSVSQNFFLGRELSRGGILGKLRLVDRVAMKRQSVAALSRLGVTLPNPDAVVEDLSGGQKQSIAIMRAANWAESVIILDEPTAALGVRQTSRVLETIQRVSEAGTAVIWISHDLPHVFDLAHRLVVLRQGSLALETDVQTTTPQAILAAMLGVQSGGSGL